MELVLRLGNCLWREVMRLTSLIREFPSRKVNNHLDIEVDTLSHKLLNTDNLHLVGAGRERVLGGQV